MNPINHLNPIEQNLCNKADLAQIPIAGNIELLPLCNMNCKMCFSKMTAAEMNAHAPMHDYKEWLEIAEQASDAGTVFLLLTGGEPFLFPDFELLYTGLKKMGYIISINTNGTLITKHLADYLAQDLPRRMNVTLYGASDETYGRLCGNSNGFTQVMNGVKLLKERGISMKFNCSLTPYNIQDLEEIQKISVELDIPIDIGYYMFPPVRNNNIGNERYRLSAEEAGRARFQIEKFRYGAMFDKFVAYSLDKYRNYQQQEEYQTGYTCRSGNSVYWINYDGTLSACSFTNDFRANVFEKGFQASWNQLLAHVGSSRMSEKCHNCSMLLLCGRCAASAISETGHIGGVPDYYCRLTRSYIKALIEWEEKNENKS